MKKFLCRIRNASQLVAVASKGEKFKAGKAMDQIEIIENGSLIIGLDGRIVDVGKTTDLDEKYAAATFETDLDCTGKSVVPGLIDGHTHPVWSGDRCHEFGMKLAGATYMEIHKMGGGIGYTVRETRNSTEEELQKLLKKRLDVMLKNGTTTVEAKSGYGLNAEAEIKMLKVIHDMKSQHPIELVANYLGGHSVPKETNLQDYTNDILTKQIPLIAQLKNEGKISPEFIDVFHEKGVFETEETRKVLKAGKEAGLLINFHGDELNAMQSAELAAELDAVAVSHLEKISEEGMKLMAQKGIVGVLLPTTAYILRIHYPPARKMIDEGMPVSLASDFNPNAHCSSLPFVMNLACVQMRMTMKEALVACTLNAAASLNRSQTHGSLEKGKVGDVVIVDNPDWQHIIYEIVNSPIDKVIKGGKVVYSQ